MAKKTAADEARELFKRVKQQASKAGQNLSYGLWHSPVGQAAVQTQRFIESPKPVNVIPSFSIPQNRNGITLPSQLLAKLNKYQQPIRTAQQASEGLVQGLVNLPKTIIESPINETLNTAVDTGRIIGGQRVPQYGDLKSNLARTSYNIASTVAPSRVNPKQLGIKNTPQEFLGNYAGAAAPFSIFAGGVNPLKYTPTSTQGAFAKGAVNAGLRGLPLGFLQGLAKSKDSKTKIGAVR